MKIVFIGTVEFSYQALQALIQNNKNVVAVICKDTNTFNSDHTDLRPLCVQHNIPYKTVKNINHPNNVSFIKSFEADLIYCFGWSQLIGHEILNMPRIGVIGFHPAALPHNRGRHPIIWALCLGLEQTASSFFYMDEGADTGDILSQEKVVIDVTDDARSLYNKIMNTAINQILNFTTDFEAGIIHRIPQQGVGNEWRKRGVRDGEIDFRMRARDIYNLVRALTHPYVGAHVTIEQEQYKVWACEAVNAGSINDEPGKILSHTDQELIVKTAEGAVRLINHEIPSTLIKKYL